MIDISVFLGMAPPTVEGAPAAAAADGSVDAFAAVLDQVAAEVASVLTPLLAPAPPTPPTGAEYAQFSIGSGTSSEDEPEAASDHDFVTSVLDAVTEAVAIARVALGLPSPVAAAAPATIPATTSAPVSAEQAVAASEPAPRVRSFHATGAPTPHTPIVQPGAAPTPTPPPTPTPAPRGVAVGQTGVMPTTLPEHAHPATVAPPGIAAKAPAPEASVVPAAVAPDASTAPDAPVVATVSPASEPLPTSGDQNPSLPPIGDHIAPTVAPEAAPTVAPEAAPTVAAEAAPTVAPEAAPAVAAEAAPTVAAEAAPTVAPEAAPAAMAPPVAEALIYDATELLPADGSGPVATTETRSPAEPTAPLAPAAASLTDVAADSTPMAPLAAEGPSVEPLPDVAPAPAPASQPLAQPDEPVHIDRIAESLRVALRTMPKDKPNTITLTVRLDPPELGAVKLRVVANGERVQVTLQADSPEAVVALQDRRHDVAALLRNDGFVLDGFDIERHDNQRGRDTPEQSRRRADDDETDWEPAYETPAQDNELRL